MSTPLPAGAAPRSARAAALWTGAAAASAAAAAVLYRFNPLESTFYPKCILFSLTGIYCPGCGALRATHALLHGHLLTALDYNALYVAVLPFLVYGLASQALPSVTGRRLPTYALSGRESRAILWLFIAFMLLRNLPLYPLSVLAP
ncbi:MAG: DUF2752 domain-containing protein [Longimicrobiaceae bacterium]